MRVSGNRQDWLVKYVRRLYQQRWIPLVLGLFMTVAVFGLWQQLVAQEHLHIQQLVQQDATAIGAELSQELSTRIQGLERMAKRWEARGGKLQETWTRDVENYLADFYGYRAIAWVDPSFRVRWVIPLEGNEAAQNLDLSQEPRRRVMLQVARDLRQTSLTRTISLIDGERGFLACVPIFVDEPDGSPLPGEQGENGQQRFDGFILGVFEYPIFFDSVTKTSPRYWVQIYDRQELVYSQEASVDVGMQRNPNFWFSFLPSFGPKNWPSQIPGGTAVVRSYGADWEIRVFPTPELMSEARSRLPIVVLWGGLTVAWILPLVVHLGQRALYQAQQMQWINQQLQAEIVSRHQAEADLREMATVMENAVSGISKLDHQGRYCYVNKAYADLMGYTPDEMMGMPWQKTVHPDEQETMAVLYQQMCQEGYVDAEIRGMRRDGSFFYKQLVMIAAYKEQQFHGHYCFMKDVSDRKQAEAALLNQMEAAEAANLAKSTFLANMSHELRTPLNIILGFAQVMTHDTALTPTQREDLQTIRRSGDHLLNLINDVLDLSKIEAGHSILEEKEFDLTALLHTLHTMMAERAQAKGLQLTFHISPDVPPFVMADEQKLRQILLNLLNNAIKFTRHGNITLSVRPIHPHLPIDSHPPCPDPVFLEFAVADTGIGIAPEDLHTIFDAFVQAEAGKKAISGTGLGLTISRKLVELMQGTIRVQSSPNAGSTFTATVPVYPICEVKERSESANRTVIGLVPNQPKRRILIADDQQESRLLMVRLLTQIGLEVREASHGQEAIQHWQDWQPDLIWMDIQMPQVDGYEATRQIRTLEQESKTVIIALTAQASQADRTLALAVGCNDYVSKPFREEAVYAKMAEYLGLNYLYADPLPANLATPTILKTPDTSTTDPLVLPDRTILPDSWLAEVEKAAICGNDWAIAELAKQLPPEFATFATHLVDLANEYEFEDILTLLRG